MFKMADIRDSASGTVGSGLIRSKAKSETLILVFTASLLDARSALKGQCGEQAGKFLLLLEKVRNKLLQLLPKLILT